MSNCVSLISCDGSCRNIHNISGSNRTPLLPYIDDLVQINNNKDCTYFVRNVNLVGFVIDTAEFLCGNKGENLGNYPFVQYRLNSLVYNGVQYVNTPIFYDISVNDLVSSSCLVCNDINGTSCVDTLTNNYNNSNVHVVKLNNIFNNLGLDLKTYPFGATGATVFRLFSNDYFSFELQRFGTLNPGVYNFIFNNSGLDVKFNNNEITENLVVETTYTCTNVTKKESNVKEGFIRTIGLSPNFIINSVTGVTGCSITNTFPGYLPVSDCDVITLYPMDVSCLITNTLGKTGATRTATLVVTGGTPPYTFEWDNGNRTNTITNLPAGTYNATVTDYFGDFVINTSCDLPPINCESANIVTVLSYICQSDGANLNGVANLQISTSGSFPPYTYQATINNVPTMITNNMIVSHNDIINVETNDSNGCFSNIIAVAFINCPPASPLPQPPPNCDISVICPTTPNTFQLSITATTSSQNNFGFRFNLSSSTYNDVVTGSYKIYNVDFPNTFLNINNNTNQIDFGTPITWTGYTKSAEQGSPSVQLNDYMEFGFNELTPTQVVGDSDPWIISIEQGDYTTINGGLNGTDWVPGATMIFVDISLFDKNYCVYKSVPLANSFILPNEFSTQTYSIIF